MNQQKIHASDAADFAARTADLLAQGYRQTALSGKSLRFFVSPDGDHMIQLVGPIGKVNYAALGTNVLAS